LKREFFLKEKKKKRGAKNINRAVKNKKGVRAREFSRKSLALGKTQAGNKKKCWSPKNLKKEKMIPEKKSSLGKREMTLQFGGERPCILGRGGKKNSVKGKKMGTIKKGNLMKSKKRDESLGRGTSGGKPVQQGKGKKNFCEKKNYLGGDSVREAAAVGERKGLLKKKRLASSRKKPSS